MSQRRIVIILLLFCVPFALLEIRLFWLQVLNAAYYHEQAQKRASRIELIAEGRGKILDRNSRVLAQDEISFDLYYSPVIFRKAENVNQTISRLAKLLETKPELVKSKIDSVDQRITGAAEKKPPREKNSYLRDQNGQKHKILTGVPLKYAFEIEANPALFPGIYVAENIRRLYPNGRCAAHILGYVTPIWKEEYPKLKEEGFFKDALSPDVENGIYEILLTRGDFKDDYIGRMGVEKKYDIILRGRSGIKLIDYDYYSKQKHELNRIGSMAGQDISLTIDTALQLKMDQLMKNISGAAVVMDVTNGEILALACSPTFDPNLLQPPVSPETLQYVNNKTIKPLYNRAISGQYAIGSVFKVMTAVAALEEGRITENTTFYCNGYFSKTSRHFKCWVADYQREHGNMALNDGIKNSCNVYFFNIGKLAGAEAILKWAHEFGFGESSGIDLPAEARGLLPDPARGVSDGRVWTPSDTLNISIGQGDLMVTPIQVVRMMAAISNGGYLVTPHIVRNGAPEPPRKINVSDRTLNAVRQGLYSVVQTEGGTAHGSGLAKFPVAGKTSTAELGGSRKPHAWFAGFAPYQKPKYAFVVMAENAGKGSEIAAPIAAGFMPEIMACLSADLPSVTPAKEGALMKTGTQPAQRKPVPEEEEDEGPTDD